MAFNFSSSKDRSNRSKHQPLAEINVTPLVDVMLVLLIIFMVTSPMLISGIKVDLPETVSAPMTGQDEPLTLTISADGKVFIHDSEIEQITLVQKLRAITKEKMDTRIFVRGDKKLNYGKVVEVVAEITNAGFTKVALVTNIKHKN